jgi:hypothetical protein
MGGREAVGVVKEVFAAWYRFKDGGGDRATLQDEIAPGAGKRRACGRAFCDDVTKLEPALWTLLTAAGVEPTNNAAERALRPAVL